MRSKQNEIFYCTHNDLRTVVKISCEKNAQVINVCNFINEPQTVHIWSIVTWHLVKDIDLHLLELIWSPRVLNHALRKSSSFWWATQLASDFTKNTYNSNLEQLIIVFSSISGNPPTNIHPWVKLPPVYY